MSKYIYILIFVLLLVAGGLEIFNIHLSSKLASDSVIVKELQVKIDEQKEKNQIMNSKVLESTSFEVIASRAAELGFIDANKYISLQNNAKLSLSR